MNTTFGANSLDTDSYTFRYDGLLTCENGQKISPVDIYYRTCGLLNKSKNNTLLLFSGLYSTLTELKHPWWNKLIGPGKVFDSNKYFIITADCLGSSHGTTGPSSFDPKTNKPYGMTFPSITCQDILMAHEILLEHLGIKKLHGVIGLSFGANLAIQWLSSHTDITERSIIIAGGIPLSLITRMFYECAIETIMNDSSWNKGNYYFNSNDMLNGSINANNFLSFLFGHELHLESKRQQFHNDYPNDQACSRLAKWYLNRGKLLTDALDPNSLIYLLQASLRFQITPMIFSLENEFNNRLNSLFISYNTDKCFKSSDIDNFSRKLIELGHNIIHQKIDTIHGHSACIYDLDKIIAPIKQFLSE